MRGSSTEIRQQLRNQSLDDLLSSSIQTVGGRIFPDDLAVIDMDAFNQIIRAWRSTHVATYGNVIPNTGAIQENIPDGSGVSPGNNEVLDVVAISLANGGGAPIEVSVRLGDLPIINIAVPPTGVTSSELGAIFPLTLSSTLALKFVVTSGTSADFNAKVAYQYRCK